MFLSAFNKLLFQFNSFSYFRFLSFKKNTHKNTLALSEQSAASVVKNSSKAENKQIRAKGVAKQMCVYVGCIYREWFTMDEAHAKT